MFEIVRFVLIAVRFVMLAVLLLSLAAIVVNLTTPKAHAEVELGIGYSIADSERIDAVEAYTLRVGGPLYAWAGYENPDISLMGQSIGDVALISAGLGVRHDFDSPLRLFGEFGYFSSDISTIGPIRDEAVVAKLKHDHGPIPFRPDHTVYRIGDGYGGRVGAAYLWPHAAASVSYRALKLDEGLDACTGDNPGCHFPVEGSHWQNRATLDFSAVEFGLSVRF